MDIYAYIDKYGNYTFDEEKFNDVDAIIFSYISYAFLDEILPNNTKKTIQEIGNMYIEKYNNKSKDFISIKSANKLIKYMRNTNRYKDCLIYNYKYIGNESIQFGVMSIEYQKNKVFVSFEGTDQLFSGWIEDFVLSYKFPTDSHKLAINYLNKHFTFSNKELIIGGHSKGGNLALVGALKSNFIVRNRIKKIYSADGPGLLDKEFNSKKYNKLKSKYIHIIPEGSFVGLFLNHSNDYVVKTTNKTIMSHLIDYWVINNNKLQEAKLNSFSTEFDNNLKDWFKKYNKDEKKDFVNNLNNVLLKANINSLLELTEKISNIYKLISESKEISKKNKKILIDFLELLVNCFKNATKKDIKSFFNNILNGKDNETK